MSESLLEAFMAWEKAGRPADSKGVPHAVKAMNLCDVAREHGLWTLVETGTCHGGMIEAVGPYFDKVYTIEMLPSNVKIARGKLRRMSHVDVLEGDSAVVLADLAPTIDTSALFFLDAHYSGGGTARGEIDTPVVREMEIIGARQNPEDVVVIDDLRLFKGEAYHTDEFKDYPSYDEVEALVQDHFIWHSITRGPDCIIIYPYEGSPE